MWSQRRLHSFQGEQNTTHQFKGTNRGSRVSFPTNLLMYLLYLKRLSWQLWQNEVGSPDTSHHQGFTPPTQADYQPETTTRLAIRHNLAGLATHLLLLTAEGHINLRFPWKHESLRTLTWDWSNFKEKSISWDSLAFSLESLNFHNGEKSKMKLFKDSKVWWVS